METAVPGILWNQQVQELVAIDQSVGTFPTKRRVCHFFSNYILKLREGLGYSLRKADCKLHGIQLLWFEDCYVAWMDDEHGER